MNESDEARFRQAIARGDYGDALAVLSSFDDQLGAAYARIPDDERRAEALRALANTNFGRRDARSDEVHLAMQSALLQEVSSRLRAVMVRWDENSIHFDAYYDGEPTEDEVESMSCVETELWAMSAPDHTISHNTLRWDHPRRVPHEWTCVYHRNESQFSGA